MADKAPLLKFSEAERVGNRLHDHWLKMAGTVPFAWDDPAWADIVKQVERFSRDVLDEREKSDG